MKEELLALERDAKRGKIDHPPHGSKDLADALAGVVHGISLRRRVWLQHEISPDQHAPDSLKRSGQSNDWKTVMA